MLNRNINIFTNFWVVYNFSNKEKRGFIQLIGCRAAGFPDKEFTLEPMSKKLFLVELAPQTKQGKITVSGKFNGLPTTKLVIPFSAEKISAAPMSILLPEDAGALEDAPHAHRERTMHSARTSASTFFIVFSSNKILLTGISASNTKQCGLRKPVNINREKAALLKRAS